MSQSSLARRLNCSQQYIHLCEEGKKNAYSHIQELSEVLDFPEDFFTQDDIEPLEDSVVSFRKRKSATMALRARVTGFASIAVTDVSRAIRRYVDLPPLSIPDLHRYRDRPSRAADHLREDFNLGWGPIDNMVHLLEARGIEVYFLNEESRSVDALCFWRDERAFVLLNRRKQDGSRARFDAAHELGHLVLHRGRDFENEPNDEAEREADAFASAFLLPEKGFLEEAPDVFDLDDFYPLRDKWRVSIQAMVRRLYDTGRFTKWQYEDGYMKMAALGFRSGPEPGAPPRESSFVHRFLVEALGDQRVHLAQFAKEANLGLDDLCTIIPEMERTIEDGTSAKAFFQELISSLNN